MLKNLPFSNFLRVLQISYILLKHGFDEMLIQANIASALKFLIWISPSRWLRTHSEPRGKRIREALEDLGPIFVKFGQQLSTRKDLLPDDIIQALQQLQDRVTPFSGILAKELLIRSLKVPFETVFESFEMPPLASASIAQVHGAVLHNGQSVVVKILRPDIHKQVKKDIELLKSLANFFETYWKKSRPFKPLEMVTEFEHTLLNELDLLREAANASQLKRNFSKSPLLYIPEMHWPLTSHSVLVMERIEGIPIADHKRLEADKFKGENLAEGLIEIFFTSVFRDAFFHADMHPGNIFILPKSSNPLNNSSPQFCLVDFGIMGSLSPSDQYFLAENFMALLKRDYRRVTLLHIESGWIPANTRVDAFESALRTICEPMFERPMREISFAELLSKLFQMATKFRINIQPQLILLQKTLMNIESLSRTLDPDIDIWGKALPFLEKWMRKQVGLFPLLEKLKNQAPDWIDKLPELPNLIYGSLSKLSRPTNMMPQAMESSIVNLNKNTSVLSFKDVCIGILLGISLCLLGIMLRSYF